MTMINEIDEITAFPNGDGSFEINISNHIKDKDGNIRNGIVRLPHMLMSMEASGGLGNKPTIKLIFEGS